MKPCPWYSEARIYKRIKVLRKKSTHEIDHTIDQVLSKKKNDINQETITDSKKKKKSVKKSDRPRK